MPKQQPDKTTLSRRALIGAAAGPLLTTPVNAQKPAANGEGEDVVAAEQLRASFEQMRRVRLPMAVEPATVFRP